MRVAHEEVRIAGSTGRRRIALTAAFALWRAGCRGLLLPFHRGGIFGRGANPGQERAYRARPRSSAPDAPIRSSGGRPGTAVRYGHPDRQDLFISFSDVYAGRWSRAAGHCGVSVENDRVSQGIWTGRPAGTGIESGPPLTDLKRRDGDSRAEVGQAAPYPSVSFTPWLPPRLQLYSAASGARPPGPAPRLFLPAGHPPAFAA